MLLLKIMALEWHIHYNTNTIKSRNFGTNIIWNCEYNDAMNEFELLGKEQIIKQDLYFPAHYDIIIY